MIVSGWEEEDGGLKMERKAMRLSRHGASGRMEQCEESGRQGQRQGQRQRDNFVVGRWRWIWQTGEIGLTGPTEQN